MSELKPCPFCGSHDVYLLRDGDKDELVGWVTCCDCEGSGPIVDTDITEENVAAKWNTRNV
jgi:Lar family restriction alleviation protein